MLNLTVSGDNSEISNQEKPTDKIFQKIETRYFLVSYFTTRGAFKVGALKVLKFPKPIFVAMRL